MRSRLLVLLAASTLSVCLTACGGGDDKITIAGPAAQPDETTGTVAPDDNGTVETGTDDSGTDEAGTDDTISGSDLPDFSEIEGMEGMQECMTVASAIAGMGGEAMGLSPEESDQAVADAKDLLPDELEGDFDKLMTAFEALNAGDMDAMEQIGSDTELEAASTRLQGYLEEICPGMTGG